MALKKWEDDNLIILEHKTIDNMERQQNELPEFMSYKDKFTQSGFIEKISKIAKRAGSKLVYAALILYYTLQSESVSLKDKTMILAALGYLISPLDVMPDAIPIAGLSDDLGVLLYVLRKVWTDIPEDV